MIAVEVGAFGGPEVLRVVEREPPVPGVGEVLVQIEACGLNWSDVLQRAGLYPGGPKPPFVAGQEAAGIVVAHGAGVSEPAIGSRVSVIARHGLAAEFAAVPAHACIAWPAEVDVLQRAGLPIALVTAHHALAVAGRGVAGELCVIHAAAGGLGSIAVQIARVLGIGVIATCSPAKRAHVVGADRVCGIDELREAAPDGVDLVLDSVGGAAYRASIAVLRPFGRIVIVGATSGVPQQIDAIKLLHRSHAAIGVHLKAIVARRDLLEQTLAACMPWVIDGRVRAKIDALPLRSIAVAHERLAARQVIDKLVLSVA